MDSGQHDERTEVDDDEGIKWRTIRHDKSKGREGGITRGDQAVDETQGTTFCVG
jgi:hypothetical protein